MRYGQSRVYNGIMPRRQTAPFRPDQYELVRRWITGKRKALGIDQRQLATWAKISEPMLSGIETGKRTPGLTSLRQIAHAFGMSVDAMLMAAGVTDRAVHDARIEVYTDRIKTAFTQLTEAEQEELVLTVEAMAKIKRSQRDVRDTPDASGDCDDNPIIGRARRLPLGSPDAGA